MRTTTYYIIYTILKYGGYLKGDEVVRHPAEADHYDALGRAILKVNGMGRENYKNYFVKKVTVHHKDIDINQWLN